jgi:tetratricopeptide (TPR) repeat protein
MTAPRFLILLVTLAMLGRVARADDPPAVREAKHHFERGEKLYALTKFGEAIDEYQKAFDAKPIPAFLFNIGQCYRNLGDYDAAIFSYRKYLKLAPDASNREQVEQLIADLEAKKEHDDTERLGLGHRAPPPPTTPEHAPDHPVYTRWWFWTGALVIGAAGGIGIYEATRKTGGAPTTDLGNIVFGK